MAPFRPTHLLACCLLFKVRIQAAAALGALPSRRAYGAVFPDALQVVAGTLESLQAGGEGGAASGGSSAGRGEGSADGSGSRPVGSGSTGEGQADEESGGGGGARGGGGLFNFRHLPALMAQLQVVLLALLAHSQAADGRCAVLLCTIDFNKLKTGLCDFFM